MEDLIRVGFIEEEKDLRVFISVDGLIFGCVTGKFF